MHYQLGILGGVGSDASAYLYEKILKHTAVDKDQDHLDMVILNHASIPDRTSYILDHSNPSPLPHIISDIEIFNKLQVEMIVIPCNTSYYFYDEYSKYSNVPIYHLIDETIKNIKSKNIQKVGILATDGTIQSGLYQNSCEKFHIKWEIPCISNQKKVMDMIYTYLKKGDPVPKELFESVLYEMKEKKVECIILACTELYLLKEMWKLSDFFIYPLDICTNNIIKHFNKNLK